MHFRNKQDIEMCVAARASTLIIISNFCFILLIGIKTSLSRSYFSKKWILMAFFYVSLLKIVGLPSLYEQVDKQHSYEK